MKRTRFSLIFGLVLAFALSVGTTGAAAKQPITIINGTKTNYTVWAYDVNDPVHLVTCETISLDADHTKILRPHVVEVSGLLAFHNHCGNYDKVELVFTPASAGTQVDHRLSNVPWGATITLSGRGIDCNGCN